MLVFEIIASSTMFSFKKRFSNPFKRQTFRDPKKSKIVKWSELVLETVDKYTDSMNEITAKQRDSNDLKLSLVSVNKVLLERIAACSKHCYTTLADVRDENIALEIEPNHKVANPFHESVSKVTQDLFHIQVCLENAISALNRSVANCFTNRLKDIPIKRQELEKSLTFGLQCVDREMQRQGEHERLYGFKKPNTTNLSLLKKNPPTSKQLIEWNEAMAMAQVSEAVRLTDDAFVKVNNDIKKSQEEMRGDIIKFLKQFIVIELQYHCKALEHLTKAFNSAKHCEKLVPISVEPEEAPDASALKKIVEELAELDEEIPSYASGTDYVHENDPTNEDHANKNAITKKLPNPADLNSNIANLDSDQTPNGVAANETFSAMRNAALRELYHESLQKSPILTEKMLSSTKTPSSVPVDLRLNKSLQETLLPSNISMLPFNRGREASGYVAKHESSSQLHEGTGQSASEKISYQASENTNASVDRIAAANKIRSEAKQKSNNFAKSNIDSLHTGGVEKQLQSLLTSSNSIRNASPDHAMSRFEKAIEQLSAIDEFDQLSLTSSKVSLVKANNGDFYSAKKTLSIDDEFEFSSSTNQK